MKDHTGHQWERTEGVKPSLAATEFSEIKIPAKEEGKITLNHPRPYLYFKTQAAMQDLGGK